MSNLPNLSPHELEALALLMEECCETGQAIGKALRHGLHSFHPQSIESNRDAIAREAGQVIAAIYIAVNLGVIASRDVDEGIKNKWAEVGQYLHHIDIDAFNRQARRKP